MVAKRAARARVARVKCARATLHQRANQWHFISCILTCIVARALSHQRNPRRAEGRASVVPRPGPSGGPVHTTRRLPSCASTTDIDRCERLGVCACVRLFASGRADKVIMSLTCTLRATHSRTHTHTNKRTRRLFGAGDWRTWPMPSSSMARVCAHEPTSDQWAVNKCVHECST